MINNNYPEAPIVPTNIGMNFNNYHDDSSSNLYPSNPAAMTPSYVAATTTENNTTTARKGRRPLPRRHTVSTPYATSNINLNHTSATTITNNAKSSVAAAKDTSDNKSVGSGSESTGGGKAPSRKSSLKAKRHRSLGKLDSYGSTSGPSSPPPVPNTNIEPLLSAKLELWTHEQLLERVMELEKEKGTGVTRQISSSLTGGTTMNEGKV